MLIKTESKEAELNRLLADLSTPCLSDNVVLVNSTPNVEEESTLGVTSEGVTSGVIQGDGDVEMTPEGEVVAADAVSTIASTINNHEEYLVTDSSDYMDSIDGEDMTTHPVTVSEISPQTLIAINSPPQTTGEATHPEDVDDNGDHIYVNRHMVPMCANNGDVDLDAVPTISDINPTPPTTPPGHCLYENLPEDPPADSNTTADLYENLREDISTNISNTDQTEPPPSEAAESFHQPASPFSVSLLDGEEEFIDPSIALLEMSNLDEKDDLLEDKLKPDVESLRRRLWFYLRQDVRRQNIKFCYDLLDNIAIKDAHGVPLLVQLMKTSDNFEIQELITGVFWNLSSSDQVKPQLLRQALEPIVKSIIIPQSGWKGSQIKHELSGEMIQCTTVFRNATGCLRNLSSAGLDGRQVMRSCYGLVDSLLFVLRCVQGKNDVDNKAVENSVCILRNLSYRLESEVSPEHKYGQVEDWRSRGLGGGQFKRKDPGDEPMKKKKNTKKHKGKENATPLPEHTNGVGLLWQPSVVRVYLDLLLECSNPETLEGAAGTLQNLTACSWEPAQLLREAVRREKGLSVISSLLRMSNDLVVRSIAVCLRNLASDSKNKELLGQNTLSDLVNRLPGGEGADGITDMTIGAIISTILELVTGSPETARLLKVQNGIPRLVDISRSTDVYSGQCVHVSNRVLAACWEIRDLRKTLKLKGWNIGMLQRLPPPDRTDGLEYDETKNQFKASYNDGLNRPHQNTLNRQRSPGRHLSPDRHRSPTRHMSPHHGRRVLSPSGYDHNTHRAATMGRAMDPSLGYHRPERPFEDYDMARGQSLPARSLPPTHPLNSNYGVADSWV